MTMPARRPEGAAVSVCSPEGVAVSACRRRALRFQSVHQRAVVTWVCSSEDEGVAVCVCFCVSEADSAKVYSGVMQSAAHSSMVKKRFHLVKTPPFGYFDVWKKARFRNRRTFTPDARPQAPCAPVRRADIRHLHGTVRRVEQRFDSAAIRAEVFHGEGMASSRRAASASAISSKSELPIR